MVLAQRLFHGPTSYTTPYFSLESRYRCATKQRDEGSWTKTRRGLARVGCEPVNGEPLLGRLPTSTRLPNDCAKGVWMAGWLPWLRAWQNLTRRRRLCLLRCTPTPSLAVQYLCLTLLTRVPTYLPTHTRTHRSLTSVLFLGATAGRPRARVPVVI